MLNYIFWNQVKLNGGSLSKTFFRNKKFKTFSLNLLDHSKKIGEIWVESEFLLWVFSVRLINVLKFITSSRSVPFPPSNWRLSIFGLPNHFLEMYVDQKVIHICFNFYSIYAYIWMVKRRLILQNIKSFVKFMRALRSYRHPQINKRLAIEYELSWGIQK